MRAAKKSFVRVLAARLSEPSTWAGLSGAAAGLVPVLPQFAPVLTAAALVAGAVAAILREGEK